ncbi:MAG: DoxX family protein [Candidatus Nomurabacteria bacterium GW2011_GWA2_40_9]|uniref:DoxX family protein n=1 Tax=Candidatus Nomurabacteria bacterium GW2011_GWA2_40_9 TaxID=1618734 RepID=A0A0G0TWV6_9BACT|nr:MAG: DoxX family protein [Candidatus Nomurabacteria bacterium GW2011_GWA2_40_9]
MNKQQIVSRVLRLAMGFIFLWAFLDKTFGLGFATVPEKSWINGGSPTFGFLSFGVKGPFVEFFHSLAGVAIVDWMFMLGLLFIGLTLVLNKFVKWGAIAGALMMVFMYLALLFPENNPIIDEHIIYMLVLMLIGLKSQE